LSTLSEIYGEGAGRQGVRYAQALAAFRTAFGPGEVYTFRAPGRVNLIGEHTDYNHGYVLPVALDRDILLLARRRTDSTVRLCNLEAGYAPLAFRAAPDIPPAMRGDWGNYARAAAQALVRRAGPDLAGLDGLVVGGAPYGVPRGAGLSSSSALTVVVAVALAHFNGQALGPDAGDVAHPAATAAGAAVERAAFAFFCSQAEWYVGTRGGIMDHFAALVSRRDQALFLDCRPDAAGRYATEHLPLPDGYRLLVVDSGVHHENARGQFNERVACCRAGVGLLQKHYAGRPGATGGISHLRDLQDVPWRELEALLPEEITPRELRRQAVELGDLPGLDDGARLHVRARCRHVWSENRRVLAAAAALRAKDVATLGELLNEAHASARDDYEISCPEVESLVRAAHETEGVAGARLTGAGWGGCMVALVHTSVVAAFEEHVRRCYAAETGRVCSIFACRAGPGAGLVDL
jgi:galactokinase